MLGDSMDRLFERLGALAPDRVLKNEPMSAHTTFKVGGPADICFFPAAEDELICAMEAANDEGAPCMVMGNGSNMIVRDGGIRGLVIILGSGMGCIDINGARMNCQAGASLAKVSAAAMEASLTGLEFASGIPGTLGGGVAMNAGAYGGELSQVLVRARVLRNGAVVEYTRDEMEMGYRSTRPLKEGSIVLSAEFELKKGERESIAETMRDLNARRRDKQPLNFPSAGSTFKRPEGYFAGALIEQAGLKGASVGGAMVSEKHAGFIINAGGATASDVISLIEQVRERVMARFGVMLETEVRIAGED
jgi:UDP-N-acetylmuramate dehydrogenase